VVLVVCCADLSGCCIIVEVAELRMLEKESLVGMNEGMRCEERRLDGREAYVVCGRTSSVTSSSLLSLSRK